jgi:formylglycine-generating enzyme required for sulfatase activity
VTPGALLTVLATVVAIDGGVEGETARIDQGLVEGLRPGDRGSLHYLLKVGDREKRIDLGEVEVVAVGEHSATLGKLGDRPVRPGFRVEFELPAERLAPAGIVAAAREALGVEVAQRLARGFLEALVAQDEELLAAQRAQLTEPQVEHGASIETLDGGVSQVERSAPAATRDLVLVRGGHYWIGSDLDGATFHNEAPRFEAWIDAFQIDRLPMAPPATGISHGEAERYCRNRGERLPTEFEWEVAARSADVVVGSPPLEWTSSWYLPYPGNRRPEVEYGETFRVVRGASAEAGIGPRQRRFMPPDQRSPRLGFRCARSTRP